MKRDMNLIRQMLLLMEAESSSFAPDFKIKGYTDEQIGYHAYLIMEAGLADGMNTTGFGSPSHEASLSRLTWAGHEFIDAARDEKRWKQVMGQVAERAGSVTIDVLKQLLVASMRASMGLS